jgi:hypothetical protein
MTTIPLHSTKKGTISVLKIEKPYGEDSASVASIGISLTGDSENPDWKVHIPMDNVEEVIKALQALS